MSERDKYVHKLDFTEVSLFWWFVKVIQNNLMEAVFMWNSLYPSEIWERLSWGVVGSVFHRIRRGGVGG